MVEAAEYIYLTPENIDEEHICCAFSDKKCVQGTLQKKEWLRKEFDEGYVFRRLNERAKVFIEYGPAESAWVPVNAPNYFYVGCLWVSGQYKGKGHAKALLQSAFDDAVAKGKNGLVTVAGVKKFHFMSDAKWLIGQGFEVVETLPSGFQLLVKKVKQNAPDPEFMAQVKSGEIEDKDGFVVYYSDRCPFTDYHVNESLKETADKRGIEIKKIKLGSYEQARQAPTPATIFSLFRDGKFVTTDVSVCMDSRFDKIIK